jgi:hypothetical protein
MDRPAAFPWSDEMFAAAADSASDAELRIAMLKMCALMENEYVTFLIKGRNHGLGGVVVLSESMIVRICVARHAVRNAATRDDMIRASPDILDACCRIVAVRALLAVHTAETDSGSDDDSDI